MKSIFKLLPLVLLSIACSAQNQESEAGGKVSVSESVELLKGDSEITVLDVRSPEEVANGYIKGATMINFHDSDFKSKIEELPKDQTYLVYCHAGGRSAKTMKIMNKLGFEKVYNMKGGITAWKKEGNETVQP